MKIRDLLIIDDKGNFTLDWDTIVKIPQFEKLKTTFQNPLWHSEGDVWTHTRYTAINALYSSKTRKYDDTEFVLFVIGALFHDIGKGSCTVFNKEKNSWSSKEHPEIGCQMIRDILDEEEISNVKIIEFYVRNHMLPLEISDDDIDNVIKNIDDETGDGVKYFLNLIKLKRCDCLASIMKKDDLWDYKLQRLYNMYV